MKKILSICLAIFMLVPCAITVSAHEITIQDKIEYLVDQGLPEAFVTNRTDEEINEMYSTMYGQNIVYMGTETVTMTEGTSEGEATTYGAIPEEDMTFSITKVANVSYDTTLKRKPQITPASLSLFHTVVQ